MGSEYGLYDSVRFGIMRQTDRKWDDGGFSSNSGQTVYLWIFELL